MRRAVQGAQRPQDTPRRGHSAPGIEQVAYLVVTGNRLNAEHRPGIVLSLGLLQVTLGLQKRRRLGEKDTKGTPGGILDAITGVWPWFAMGRQCLDPSVQDAREIIEA